MLCLSQTTGYAILALSCLDEKADRWVLARDIAACTGVPLPYLSKILHSLGRNGLVCTKRGYRGGMKLGRPASEISLMEVVEAVEGRDWAGKCLLGLDECSDLRACPTHEFWKVARGRIEDELRRLTLAEVADFERRQGGPRLKGCSAVGGAGEGV